MPKNGPATVLLAGARLVGDLVTDEDVVMAGTLEGTLRTSRSLQVTATGCVKGAIHAESVVVLGRVTGPITADDRIELQPGARVEGDLNAQRVRICDDVIFNGHCCITGPESNRREYLLPGIVQALGGGDADPRARDRVERAAEGFLGDFGFEIEVRPDSAGSGSQSLRPIFRSTDPLPYARLRERLRFVEKALQSVTLPDSRRDRHLGVVPRAPEVVPPQVTGADTARKLVESMSLLREAALMLGPVIVTCHDDDHGASIAVRVREDSMPSETAAATNVPDPGSLLLAMQKVQTEEARDLLASAAAARLRPHA